MIERLGAGAMGVVYRARDTLLQRDVALKLIKPELAELPRWRARFLRECQSAAGINHPGVATIYEAGESDEGWLFLASELVDGEVLRDRIDNGVIQSDEVVDLATQLAEALSSAHKTGVVHRDIKPENLMITQEGRLKILDFGLARLLDDEKSESSVEREAALTQEGAVVGTPAYMSPEQASGMQVDGRTDIFAAGCVIYEMLSGKSPFHTGSIPETLRRILCEEPPSLGSSGIQLPVGMEKIIARSMAKNREDRFPTANEMAAALREVGKDFEAGVRPSSRSPWQKWTLRAAVGMALVVLAVLTARSKFWEKPALAFISSDHILIASVDNQTGDEAFDLALRTALEVDLQQSPYARVFGQSQVADTLRLMRQDPSTPISETLGRDVCRFAGVRAMLLPRILAVGEAYELQAVLVDPSSGRHVDRFRVNVRGREEVLLTAIDELSRQVRGRLGESLESIEKADKPVTKVTTSSWMALRYFSLSNEKWGQGDFNSAADLLEMAIEKDPDFASAKGSLGLILIQFLRQTERGKLYLREALEGAGSLPEREYLMIKAVNRQFVDEDLEGALEEYETVGQLFPDSSAAFNNQGRILIRLGRYDAANELFWRAAEVEPYATVPLINLFFLNIGRRPDAVAAEAASRRLVELGPEIPGYRSFLGWALAAQGRFSEAEVEYLLLVSWEPEHPYGLPNLAHILFALNKTDEALPLYRRFLDLVVSKQITSGQIGATRDLLTVLVAAGSMNEAGTIAETEQKRIAAEAENAMGTELVRAELAIAAIDAAVGRVVEARSRLERFSGAEDEDPVVLLDLATVYALLNDRDQAIDKLERFLDQGTGDYFVSLVTPPFHSLLKEPGFLALFDVTEIS